MTPQEQANALLAQIEAAQATTTDEVEQFRITYLGTKGQLKALFGRMRDVPNTEKREFGLLANSVKQAAEAKWASLSKSVAKAADTPANIPDLSLPVHPAIGSRHPIATVMNEIIDIFRRIGYVIATGSEVVDDWHNFTALNTPEDHPARDMQDTFYIQQNPSVLLRSHTSSVQALVMQNQQPPIRIIAPGRVFRNESISARSHCQFHQVEGLYIAEDVSFADLKQNILYFVREMFGSETQIRMRPSFFPFTEPSAEVDIYWGLETEADYRITKGTGWLEILGCGMVDPNVLENCNIDPKKYSGFAFGMGIERTAMLRYKIEDIRQFFENDVRFLRQFSSAL